MAVVEVPRVKIEKIGLRPFHEFDQANDTWPRGDRPAAIREAAAEFRARFATPENRVRAVRTVDIASAGYPLKFAFGGAAKGANPYINIINRLQVVQFEDFEGQLRTLAYEPTVPEGPAEAPYYAQQIEKLGEFLSYKVLATIWNQPDEALVKVGLRPEDVDYVSFDHLHVQDLRFVLGTTEPIPGEAAPRPPLFPNAKLIAQRKEWDTFGSLHPMQWAWYVEDGKTLSHRGSCLFGSASAFSLSIESYWSIESSSVFELRITSRPKNSAVLRTPGIFDRCGCQESAATPFSDETQTPSSVLMQSEWLPSVWPGVQTSATPLPSSTSPSTRTTLSVIRSLIPSSTYQAHCIG